MLQSTVKPRLTAMVSTARLPRLSLRECPHRALRYVDFLTQCAMTCLRLPIVISSRSHTGLCRETKISSLYRSHLSQTVRCQLQSCRQGFRITCGLMRVGSKPSLGSLESEGSGLSRITDHGMRLVGELWGLFWGPIAASLDL